MKNFTGLSIDLEIADGEWRKHLTDVSTTQGGRIELVGVLPDSTVNHKPTFQLMATLDDGKQVIVETTWALMRNATRALEARWPADD